MADATTTKLVIGGPVGAGKTTAVRVLADTEPVTTEMPLSGAAASDGKQTTTVAFDFATVLMDDAPPLFVYGLPGQDHFGFMREIVFEGAIGALIILDASAATLLSDCRHWLQAVRDAGGEELPLVVGITKTDLVDDFDMASVRETVRESGPPVPIFSFDSRDAEQTGHLMRALLVSATV
jgi:signal recognition particle receptor subunit beta